MDTAPKFENVSDYGGIENSLVLSRDLLGLGYECELFGSSTRYR